MFLIIRPREHCFNAVCGSQCGARKMVYPIATLDSKKAETRVRMHKAYGATARLCSYILVSFRSSDVAHECLYPSAKGNTNDDQAPEVLDVLPRNSDQPGRAVVDLGSGPTQ